MIDVLTLSEIIDGIAPYRLAIEDDNCGVILDTGNRTEKILFALDAVTETIDEAQRLGCGMLVTHHPAIKNPQNQFPAGDIIVYAAARGISLLAAHTCYDAADGGVNDVLCKLFGIRETVPFSNVGRGGKIDAMPCADFVALVRERLGCKTVRAVATGRCIRRVAVIGGSGGGDIVEAAKQGYDALVTGEARHRDGIAARQRGVCLIEAGHFATENPAIEPLRRAVERQLNGAAQCILSEKCADPFGIF